MNDQVRAELLKQRTTSTTLALLGGMVGLVVLAIGLHLLTPSASELMSRGDQLLAFEVGTRVGMLFAALVGALAITAEFRYGTIHPTFLVAPRRTPVVAAKLVVSGLFGFVFGVLAEALMSGATTAALGARGITVELTEGDVVRLLVGGSAAAALWAVIGLGVGALVRNQIPTLVGLCAWLLLVEHLFPAEAARYLPGWAGLALAVDASTTRLADSVPGVPTALVVLAAVALVAGIAGWRSMVQRDAA